MRALWRALFGAKTPAVTAVASEVPEVSRLRAEYAQLDDEGLRQAGRRATTLQEVVGVTAVVAARVLGLQMFDVQLQGALALAYGKVIEMPTGEGKTLAAVPAVAWHARGGQGVHVLTANDYLARRDAEWMNGIYTWLGLSVAFVQQGMTAHERRTAYRADVTYATANEVGFDYLRDGLALDPDEQVHRAFAAAVIDEADSILIDEARIPLVIAGGTAEADDLAVQADRVVRELVGGPTGMGRPIGTGGFTVEPAGRNVLLTPMGVAYVERAMHCSNLFDAANLAAHTAVQDALHAHVLLRRDVDYVVHDNAVLSVDEFKGRVVHERRWPAGLQTAIECKEQVRRKTQGRVLGSITIEHLVGLYPFVCGMTGTAATQAEEFRNVYGLDVEVIPPNRPVIRIDRPDRIFAAQAEKERAVADEVRRIHATGQPVLIGTASVEASERLSRALCDVPHHVLNARHEAEEAAIIARAGELGAVTVSTNMAGRGVDIQLGPGVADLGGLHVISTNRHESRRIDHQLRGRAGRQGDPGSSEFFVSREDPLVAKYAGGDPDISPDQLQRIAEGQNLDIRLFLRKYEAVIEGQRLALAERRQAALMNLADGGEGPIGFASETERIATLRTIDDLWSDYLAAVAELRSGTTWISLGYGDPLGQYLREVHAMFGAMQGSIEAEVTDRIERQAAEGIDPRQRGATWTYITTDQPFGPLSERVIRRLVKFVKRPNNGEGQSGD